VGAPGRRLPASYCTLAVTEAAAESVNVHVRTLLPPLEQAPDQMAERPLLTVSVMAVPTLKDADPLLPLATLMPAGLEVIRSPLRPEAVTVSAAVWAGGGAGVTVRVAVRVTPLRIAEIVTVVEALTALVEMAKTAFVAPSETVALAGTPATPPLLLESETVAPPAGAAPESVTTPWEGEPPLTLDGLVTRPWSVGAAGGAPATVTVSGDDRLPPLNEAVIVTVVLAATAVVVIVNVPVKPPVGTVTLAGTLATAGLLLESETTVVWGAAALTITVPLDALPPTTVDGLMSTFVTVVGGGGACGVKLRVADHAPGTPAVLTPRTRQNCVVVASPPVM
jgi:hypothetical protein